MGSVQNPGARPDSEGLLDSLREEDFDEDVEADEEDDDEAADGDGERDGGGDCAGSLLASFIASREPCCEGMRFVLDLRGPGPWGVTGKETVEAAELALVHCLPASL